ncbi:MAG: hypothetical protein DMF71_06125 [Acidobacteria bacterium]|nr:MAG: hypothetical protein DMF71_06125 [Acidobacteriota bacterium]
MDPDLGSQASLAGGDDDLGSRGDRFDSRGQRLFLCFGIFARAHRRGAHAIKFDFVAADC